MKYLAIFLFLPVFCRFCVANNSIQELTSEDSSLLRTSLTNVEAAEQAISNNKLHVNGVKYNSSLNELKYFNISNGLPPDIMHDLLEGCFRFALSNMMEELTKQKLYNVKNLRSDLENFKNGRIDSKNRVPTSVFTDKFTYKLSASHMNLLVRTLPFIIGERFRQNIYFKNFLLLLNIFFQLNADEFDEPAIENLKNKIKFYLEDYKICYANKKLMPKHHFLTHYPSAIRNFGPPKQYSTLRFESKHSFFKRVDKATFNRKNIAKSLAFRHQQLQVYHLLCENYFCDIEFGTYHNLSQSFQDVIQFQLSSNEFSSYKWLVKRGIKYHIDDFIVISNANDLPIFSKVASIIYDKEEIIFLAYDYVTIKYIDHLAAYRIIERESNFKYYHLNNIVSKWPLDGYDKNDGFIYILPKYPF
jgi:hypothetical protein